jgi:hypothetical protein
MNPPAPGAPEELPGNTLATHMTPNAILVDQRLNTEDNGHRGFKVSMPWMDGHIYPCK